MVTWLVSTLGILSPAFSAQIDFFMYTNPKNVDQHEKLLDLKKQIVETFESRNIPTNFKEYHPISFKNLVDDVYQSPKEHHNHVVLCSEKNGRDVLIEVNRPSKSSDFFSCVHISTQLYENHLAWLRWERPLPDVVVLPEQLVTKKIEQDITMIDTHLIKTHAALENENHYIAEKLYSIYKNYLNK